MENGKTGSPRRGHHDRPDEVADGTVLGVLEDDRLRAVVTTTGDAVLVTFEGQLDEDAAPVVDELLDAVGRWPGRGDDEPEVAPGAALLLDTRRIELDPASRQMLAGHRDRWREEHGPCESVDAPPDQGSKR